MLYVLYPTIRKKGEGGKRFSFVVGGIVLDTFVKSHNAFKSYT